MRLFYIDRRVIFLYICYREIDIAADDTINISYYFTAEMNKIIIE